MEGLEKLEDMVYQGMKTLGKESLLHRQIGNFNDTPQQQFRHRIDAAILNYKLLIKLQVEASRENVSTYGYGIFQ